MIWGMKTLFVLFALIFVSASFVSAPAAAEPCPAFDAAMAEIEAALDAAQKP